MKPAPPFDCADCSRTIGKGKSHLVMTDDRVLCAPCRLKAITDTVKFQGTRAGVAWIMGLWP